ncbi:MAG TPA: FmdB family zinc ribbon protein [Candidatus Dormibacteraeota bacterium]|jgi:putative FmdB family regulatory protein
MPTYGYRCEKGHEIEVFQRITDEPLAKCQKCGAPVRRIFYPVGIVFKGPGFYKTDSRGKSPAGSSASAGGASSDTTAASTDSKTDSKPDTKSESKAETKSDSKPAKAAKSEKKSA